MSRRIRTTGSPQTPGTAMDMLVAIAGLIFVAAITPGPNNLLVFRAALRSGTRAALPAIGGVIAGGLAMLALLQFGLARILDRYAWLGDGIVLLGSAYLAWIGLALLFTRARPDLTNGASRQPAVLGAQALFGLQFVNPKAWAMFLAVAALAEVSAVGANGLVRFAAVAALFAAISFASLIAWSALGRLAASGLRYSSAIVVFDRLMGLLLVAMGLLMVCDLASPSSAHTP